MQTEMEVFMGAHGTACCGGARDGQVSSGFMRRFHGIARLLALAVPAWLTLGSTIAAQESPDEWQVVVLKPPGCVSCLYTEEMLKRRGHLQRAELSAPDGSSITARIVRRNSSELSASERQELAALPYIDMNVWTAHAAQRAAQVLLLHRGRVASAGNIADSADLRRVEFPETITAPREGADPIQLRGVHDDAYAQTFVRNWNLDYFYALALNPRLLEQRSMAGYLASRPAPTGPAPAARNLVLMATASWPGNNEIFNATRIGEIQTTAQQHLGVSPSNISVFYGGANPNAANAVEVRRGALSFARQPIPGSRPASLANFSGFFQGLKQAPPSRNLFVFVGHGAPEGAGLWGHLAPLQPADLAALHETGKADDVIVSGNCFGGVMARAMSCGFFAARPDIIATGCQADAAEVAQSKDYLKMFFGSVGPDERARADADGDGAVSFEEAHWFASVQGDTRNITYTTLDALADEWFARNPGQLPARIGIAELQQLASRAPPAEAQALKRMTDGLPAGTDLSLHNLAAQAGEWSRLQAGVRPMIAQLARRMLYVQRHAAADPEVVSVRACEARPIAAFLAP
jgi:hypothetical protein